MPSDTETIADIVAEMRSKPYGVSYELRAFANRIEAAAERMRDAYCDLCKEKDAAYDQLLLERDKAIKARAHGNAAAMREALEKMVSVFDHIAHSAWFIDANFQDTVDIIGSLNDSRAALAAPAPAEESSHPCWARIAQTPDGLEVRK